MSKLSLNCLLYADEIILVSESEKGLQCCLDSLKLYCNQWHLKENLTKPKFMVSKTGRLSKLKLYFGNDVVKETDSYCYLGTMISSCGSFPLAIKSLYKKGLKAMFALMSSVHKSRNALPELLLELFDQMVTPILLCNSEICGAFTFPNKHIFNNGLFQKISTPPPWTTLEIL